LLLDRDIGHLAWQRLKRSLGGLFLADPSAVGRHGIARNAGRNHDEGEDQRHSRPSAAATTWVSGAHRWVPSTILSLCGRRECHFGERPVSVLGHRANRELVFETGVQETVR